MMRRVDLQAHADAQAVDEHAADQVALARLARLLLDDRGHDERIVRRAVGNVLFAPGPFVGEMPLHGAVGAAQHREVARALGEKIGIGKEQPLGMGLGGAAARRQDLGFVEAGAVVAQVRARVERGAELHEGPALDQPHLGLGDVAARELLQELERRERLQDLVAAGLDGALPPEGARQELELVGAHRDAALLELLDGGAQAGAARDLDLDRQPRHRERRGHVPRGVAGRRDDEQKYEREEGSQVASR